MFTEKNVAKQEFIGKQIVITSASNQSLVGIKGRVIDETRSTFTVLTQKGEKKVIKKQVIFRTKMGNLTYELKGKIMEKRPEDRIKK